MTIEQRIAAGRERVLALRADIEAGMSEADAARKNGFLTRKDIAEIEQRGLATFVTQVTDERKTT